MKRWRSNALAGFILSSMIILISGCPTPKPTQKMIISGQGTYTATVPIAQNKVWPDTLVTKVVGADTIRLQMASGVVTVTAPVVLWRRWTWSIYCSQPISAEDSTEVPADSDGDGVPDAIDHCSNTPAGADVNAYGCACEPPDVGEGGGGWYCVNLLSKIDGQDVLKISVVFFKP